MQLLQRLTTVLEEEYDYYQQLYAVAKEKKETLITSDGNKLLKLVRRDQKLISKIEELEEERENIINKVQEKYSLTDDQLSYSRVMNELPGEWQAELAPVRENLLAVIEKFHIQNEENSNLLTQALELNKFSLEKILSKLDINSGTYSTGDSKKNAPRLLDKRG